jgi:hypothetical protein
LTDITPLLFLYQPSLYPLTPQAIRHLAIISTILDTVHGTLTRRFKRLIMAYVNHPSLHLK